MGATLAIALYLLVPMLALQAVGFLTSWVLRRWGWGAYAVGFALPVVLPWLLALGFYVRTGIPYIFVYGFWFSALSFGLGLGTQTLAVRYTMPAAARRARTIL